jgi:gliding motility-associated-like protein
VIRSLAALLLSGLLAAPAAAERFTGATRQSLRNAHASGGVASTDTVKLVHATGEVAPSSFTGAGLRLYSGLMHQLAQPGSVTSITAVTKDTTTLLLSWTAPGLDGSSGTVTGGYYRIDASSEAGHVFAPTTYTVEIPTTTTPGETHSYKLTGLLPNTTYYTKVYLADARKMPAEDSVKSEESTWAHPPVSPVLSQVDATSVTFTWTLPSGGAEGTLVQGSSTNFTNGPVPSTQTLNGNLLTLTISGLDPDTTYYFKLASLNWQGDKTFTDVYSVRTAAGGPVPPANLATTGLRLDHKIVLTWTNRNYLNADGVLVQVSSEPITSPPVAGTAYSIGSTFPDGSVVKATATATSFTLTDLALDSTRYFKLYSKTTTNDFSLEISTMAILDLPPMAPAGFLAQPAVDNSSITLAWAGVASSLDGSGFKAPAAPTSWEISRYDIYRATGIAYSNWVKIATVSWQTSSFTAANPDPTKVYYYKVVGRDLFDEGDADASMVADTKGNLYAVSSDEVSRIKIPADQTKVLFAANNKYGKNLLVRATEQAADVGGKIFKSVRFDPVLTPSGLTGSNLQWDKPVLDVVLSYQVQNGKVVPSAGKGVYALSAADAKLAPAINENEVAKQLAAYWLNNVDYVKLFGLVNPADHAVLLQSAMLGAFQIRGVLRAGAFDFDIASISNKAITPNGDGLNDTVVFVFDNPRDSSFSGKIYDIRGSQVADMSVGPVANGSLLWDGKANGLAVPSGVYIYQIKAEGKKFNGTVMVIR